MQINTDELLKIIGSQRVEIELLNRRIALYEQQMKLSKQSTTVPNKPSIVKSEKDGGKVS